jgi:hypothetical protein
MEIKDKHSRSKFYFIVFSVWKILILLKKKKRKPKEKKRKENKVNPLTFTIPIHKI